MKDMKFKLCMAIVAIVGFFALLGWAGRQDHIEYVILHMSQAEYDTICQKLTAETGDHPSDADIADYYIEHY